MKHTLHGKEENKMGLKKVNKTLLINGVDLYRQVSLSCSHDWRKEDEEQEKKNNMI